MKRKMKCIISLFVDEDTTVDILQDEKKEILYQIKHYLPFGLEINTVKDRNLVYNYTDLNPAEISDVKIIL